MVDLYLEIRPLVVGKGSVDSNRFKHQVFSYQGIMFNGGKILNFSQMARMEEADGFPY